MDENLSKSAKAIDLDWTGILLCVRVVHLAYLMYVGN